VHHLAPVSLLEGLITLAANAVAPPKRQDRCDCHNDHYRDGEHDKCGTHERRLLRFRPTTKRLHPHDAAGDYAVPTSHSRCRRPSPSAAHIAMKAASVTGKCETGWESA
jgi:hypothetical protein